jgi:hypothetical protein
VVTSGAGTGPDAIVDARSPDAWSLDDGEKVPLTVEGSGGLEIKPRPKPLFTTDRLPTLVGGACTVAGSGDSTRRRTQSAPDAAAETAGEGASVGSGPGTWSSVGTLIVALAVSCGTERVTLAGAGTDA